MKNILIIGGLGFIGSHVTKHIKNNYNCNITVLDNFSTSKKILDDQSINIIKGDISNLEEIKEIFAKQELVIFLGGNSAIEIGIKNRDIHFNQNVKGILNVLEAMVEHNVPELIFASSNTVYGDSKEKKETTGPLLPISLFGASKLSSEGIISSYSNYFGINSYIFRLGNVIGEGMTKGVIFDLVNKYKINNDHIKILGDGTQTRSFVDIKDVISGGEFVYKSLKTSNVEVFNLSTEDETSINEILENIQLYANKEIKIEKENKNYGWKGDISQVKMNIDKLKQNGWNPQYSSADATKNYIEFLMRG